MSSMALSAKAEWGFEVKTISSWGRYIGFRVEGIQGLYRGARGKQVYLGDIGVT